MEKGNLFTEILRIIDYKPPAMCILENVKNLYTHDEGRTFITIKTSLENRGYIVNAKVLNSAYYGSPQTRERLFIVATRGCEFSFPECKLPVTPVRTIIDHSVVTGWDSRDKYDLIPINSRIIPYKPCKLFDIINRSTKKGGGQGQRVYSIDSTGITLCASSGGIGSKTGLYQVGNLIRKLTVGEALRMFGFPQDYQFLGISTEDSLFYLGNSVVVNIPCSFISNIEAYIDKLT